MKLFITYSYTKVGNSLVWHRGNTTMSINDEYQMEDLPNNVQDKVANYGWSRNIPDIETFVIDFFKEI